MAEMFDSPHPGGILKEEFDYLKISVSDFAKRIDEDSAHLKLVLEQQVPLLQQEWHRKLQRL